MERLFWICLSGALGTGTRHLVNVWTAEKLGTAFPYGTLAVNVLGCFLISLVMQFAIRSSTFSPDLRLALTTGFLGGLTTYSSFNYEMLALVREGSRGAALVYGGVTLAACAVAGVVGLLLAERVVNP